MHPRQLVFGPDRLIRRETGRLVERRDRDINPLRSRRLPEKQMRPATRRKGSQSLGVRNFAHDSSNHAKMLGPHRTPRYERCARTPPAIDAMAVAQRLWRRQQHISCTAAYASSRNFHGLRIVIQSLTVISRSLENWTVAGRVPRLRDRRVAAMDRSSNSLSSSGLLNDSGRPQPKIRAATGAAADRPHTRYKATRRQD